MVIPAVRCWRITVGQTLARPLHDHARLLAPVYMVARGSRTVD